MGNLTDFFPVPTSNNVLEVIEGVADGRTVTVNGNSYTFGNVTNYTSLSTSFADLAGSSIAYTPPDDTKYVSYKCYFKHSAIDYGGIMGYRIALDGTVVSVSQRHLAGNYSNGGNNHTQFLGMAMFVFDLTASSTDINSGKIPKSSWTSDKTIKVLVRDYHSSYDAYVNFNRWLDGSGASGTRQVDKPTIQIIAYG
tara:strand:+ start:12695 stop:13282 length:588 start_codon:yes stop_codon:yes gene_type:complete